MRRLAGTTAVCLLLPAAAANASPGRGGIRTAHAPVQRVRVRLTGESRHVPRSFLGLSIEVRELSAYARAGAALDRVIAQLRSAPEEALVLRVGGRSADDAYWHAPALGAPRWVFEIDAQWVTELAALARRDDLRVTLDVNVAVHSPAMAQGLAGAVARALQPGGLAGLAIGNEPDLFRDQPGLEDERVPSTLPSTPRRWTRRYSAASYRRDYATYARALAQALPGVPLDGPETTNLRPPWLRALGGLGRLRPRSLTVHRYPFSSCWATDSPLYPRIPALLDEGAAAGLARQLRGPIRFAEHAGMPVRVTELNSMSCGGTRGVADSFATALWAPDLLLELVRAGVRGVNWHLRPQTLNAPFQVLGDTIRPLPEIYGLVLFARTVRGGGRLVHVRMSAARGVRLKAWAVRSRRREAVLLINKGPRAVTVSVSGVRATRRVRLQRLTAPTPRARDHVTLAGRRLGADGRWHGHRVTGAITRRRGGYRVAVPGYSAALLLGWPPGDRALPNERSR